MEPGDLEKLGVTPGTPVTLLQFSTAFCAPCRATRVYCADLARTIPGVRHVEVDAESHLTPYGRWKFGAHRPSLSWTRGGQCEAGSTA
jgi:hypothetical protein